MKTNLLKCFYVKIDLIFKKNRNKQLFSFKTDLLGKKICLTHDIFVRSLVHEETETDFCFNVHDAFAVFVV